MGRVRFQAIRLDLRWLVVGLLAIAVAAAVLTMRGSQSPPRAPMGHPGSPTIGLGLQSLPVSPMPSGLSPTSALSVAQNSDSLHLRLSAQREEPGGGPPRVGARPPGFQLSDLHGQRHSLQEHEGKPVVLYFWASFCPFCREDLPAFSALYDRYREETPVTVWGINVQEPPETVAQAVRELGVRFPVLLDRDGQVSRRYGVRVVPSLFFIARDGTLQAHIAGIPGPGSVEAQLRLLLNAAVPQPTALPMP